jgi:hypothetical protein
MSKLSEDDKILKGFIWKPKDRPKSKEEILPQLAEKETTPKVPVKTDPAKRPPVKIPPPKPIPAKKDTKTR